MKVIKNYIFIFFTIFFTVLGQVLTKKGQSLLNSLPVNIIELPFFLFKALFNPYIFAGLVCSVVAAMSWIRALYSFKLGYAYPFMSLSYVFVMAASIFLFNERVLPIQWVGVVVICFGIFLISRAY